MSTNVQVSDPSIADPLRSPEPGTSTPLLGSLTGLATAASAYVGLGTVLLYLTGLGFREGYLSRFGLNVGRFERDFAGTLVDGFFGLLAVMTRWWPRLQPLIWVLLTVVGCRALISAVPPVWSAYFRQKALQHRWRLWIVFVVLWVCALLAAFTVRVGLARGLTWGISALLVAFVCFRIGARCAGHVRNSASWVNALGWSQRRRAEITSHSATDPFKDIRILGWVQSVLVIVVAFPLLPFLAFLILIVPAAASTAGWVSAAATQRRMDGLRIVAESARAAFHGIADTIPSGDPVFGSVLGIVVGSDVRRTFRKGDSTIVEPGPDTTIYGTVIACSSSECAFYIDRSVRILAHSTIKELRVHPCAVLRAGGAAESVAAPGCGAQDTVPRQNAAEKRGAIGR